MHILIVSQHFWPENFRINDLAYELSRSGHEVTVLTGQPNYPEGEIFQGYSKYSVSNEEFRGIRVFRVPLIPRGRSRTLDLILNYLSFVLFASVIGPWQLRKQPFDRILVYGTSPILQAIPALVIGRIIGVKVLVWVQDLWPESLKATGYVSNNFLLKCVGYLVSWIYHRSDLILAQSEAFISAIKKLSGNTPVIFLPQPGDLVSPARKNIKSKLILDGNFNVVFAGNFGVVQSLETIVFAAKILSSEPDIRFYLVGSGSQTETISALINKMRLTNIVLPGRFNSEVMPDIFQQASVLLVTLADSKVLNLTIPGKIQSYLAQGKPILASMNGEGARIVNESQAGLVTPAGDAMLLAEAVLKLKNMSPIELERFGSNGLDYYYKNYEISIVANKLITILSASHITSL